MTICVPRKPFEVTGQVIMEILCWSPLISIILGIYASFNSNGFGVVAFMLLLVGFIFLFFTIIRIQELNENHNWIEWCDNSKQQNCNSDEQKVNSV